MKKLTLVALATLFALPAYANQTYIAADLGGGSYDMSGNISDAEIVDDLDEFGFLNIKVGQMINDNVRYYGYLQRSGAEGIETKRRFLGVEVKLAEFNLTTYEAGLGGDYLHHFTNRFYAIAGANIGVYRSKLEADVIFENVHVDMSNTGLSTGANLGLGYAFTDQFGMEVGYRHTHFFGNDFEFKGRTLEFESSNVGYVNFNYKF